MRPRRAAARMGAGMSALANRNAAWWRRLKSPGSSNIKRSCSFVMPEGPAERRLASSNVSDMGHGPATWLSTAGLSGTTGVRGRRLGSRSSASVASLLSASGSAVRARLAAESSPRWTSAAARAA